MASFTITVSDDVAEQLRAASGGDVRTWLTKLAVKELIRLGGPAIAAYDAAHDDPEEEERRLTGRW